MPKPEHVAALAQLVTHALVASPTAPKAAEVLYAAIRTDPEVQDAMLGDLIAVTDDGAICADCDGGVDAWVTKVRLVEAKRRGGGGRESQSPPAHGQGGHKTQKYQVC